MSNCQDGKLGRFELERMANALRALGAIRRPPSVQEFVDKKTVQDALGMINELLALLDRHPVVAMTLKMSELSAMTASDLHAKFSRFFPDLVDPNEPMTWSQRRRMAMSSKEKIDWSAVARKQHED